MRFAAEPRRVRLPATVLTQASMSQAFFSEAGEMAPADAATLVPSSSTENKDDSDQNHKKFSALYWDKLLALTEATLYWERVTCWNI